jgi:FK506-binding nuclear protein
MILVVLSLTTIPKMYQQPLDITIGEKEQVYFEVVGGYAVHLTGNYVIPDDDGHNHHHEVYDSEDESEEEDYDLSPDEDELDLEDMDDDESDDLDALEDPRITEVDSEEEAPKLVSKSEKKAEKKGKNKRGAEEIEEDTLDDLIAKAGPAVEAAINGEAKLSKKQLKKMKNNSGDAVATKADDAKAAKDSPASSKGDKKVQFAKNLEQGPTGSTEVKKEETKADGKGKATLGVKTIKGVKIDDKKLGTGPAAKNGDRVGMRYIGKLTDGKVFDCKYHTIV